VRRQPLLLIASLAACGGAAFSTISAQAAKTGIVWPDEGPRTWAPRPTVPAITANDLRTRLYQFADDSTGGALVSQAITRGPSTSPASSSASGSNPQATMAPTSKTCRMARLGSTSPR
jgi:hypothetical protein